MMMDEDYTFLSMLNRTETYLRSIRIIKFMASNQSSAESHEKLHDEITYHTPEYPKHCRGEET